jgi:antitoxin (DNA-binding transcriptional repressor) of toxin-antitoxin stability system
VITQRGKPLARVVPVQHGKLHFFDSVDEAICTYEQM